ncbi:MAG TPA: VWA domain-containing protein [Acidimicrobiales bacterium]|nr:VWA domain-containing protein [Acidimicrobiales bacterium]
MSFLHPERLLLLVLVAAIAVGYLMLQRRRAQAVARYTNPAMLGSIAPASLGWRRHASTALAIGALAVVVIAIAQPTRQVRVPKDEGLIVVAVDVSESMNATDVEPNRIQAAISGALDFVDKVPAGFDIGLVAFDGGARLLVSPTKDRAVLTNAIDNLQTGPGTAGGEAIYTALDSIKATINPDALATAKTPPAAIVLLSDGVTNRGRSITQAAQDAANAGVPVSTIAFGTRSGTIDIEGRRIPVPADETTMAAVADISGGNSFTAGSLGQLEDVYHDIRLTVAYTTQPREVTTWLVGFALLVLIAATGVSMALTARSL